MDEQEQDGGKIKKEIKLINSGAFGCIYSPTLTCKGKVGSSKYITKIQKSERSIINELRVSEKIRKIGGYVKFFAPVLKHCIVKIQKDRVKDLKKCELFEKDSEKTIEESSYVSMKTRYVGNKDMRAYFFAALNSNDFLVKIFRSHTHILKGIQKLFANNIVHYDLKYNNIIFDETRKSPIMIDFGQSWLTNELETEDELSSAFFVFDQYDYWCIDILICSYIIQKVGFQRAKNTLVEEAEINYIIDVLIYGKEREQQKTQKRIINDLFLYNILQNPQKMSNFKSVVLNYTKPFINTRTWWELYEDLVKYTSTWDCYSLAVIYLNNFDDLFLSNSDYYKNVLEKSEHLRKYVEILEDVLYCSPKERPSAQILLGKFESIGI